MRTIPAAIYEHLDALMTSGVLAWAVAIELTTGGAFYLTPNNEPFTYRGRTWLPFPLNFGDIEDSGEGDMPTSTLTLSNVGRVAMPYLEGVGWDQARVLRRLVFMPDPTAEIGLEIDLTVQGAVATDEAITMSLGQPNFFDRPIPPGRFVRSVGFPSIPRVLR